MRSIFQRRRTWHRKQRQSAVLTPRNQVRQLRKENGYCLLGESGDAKTGSHHSAIGIKTQSICFGTSQSLCVARPPLTATDTARVYEYGRGYFVTIHDHDFAANTHILAHAGRILATVEGGALPYEISDKLNTVGPYDFAGALPASFAAHTKTDQQKGEVHAIAYSYRQDHVQHIVIDKTGKVSRITEIAVRDKPIMHDFALTEKYVVLYDLPVTFSLDAAKAGRFPYVWNPAHEARVGLLSREDSSRGTRWFPVEPCFVFHTLNAYDDGDRACVDVCRYAGRYDVSLMTGPGPITLDRWTIDPVSGKATLRSLSDRFFQEFPRIDDRAISRPHRYGYTTAFKQLQDHVVAPATATGHTSGNVLLKHDVENGAVVEHRFEHGAAGEAVFAPASLSAGEDEGYVMAFAHDLDGGRTDMVILAAQDFAGEPVARIHLPVRVPLGFHGSWIADS
jgi:carotenoid cleavage dioxygenase-like enzyme